MSVKIQHETLDDLALAKDPEAQVPADTTIKFSVEGDEYEIDLTEKNADGFHKKLAPYMRAGRRVRSRRQRPAASRRRSGDIRNWAKDHGIRVNPKGRIPGNVIERYEAATGHRIA